jgi:acetylornithine/N-succinyldiaminopimelate aminotransferase
VELAEMLCKRTGMKKVFFCNSGAEANECAIKVARKYAAERHGEDCYTIVTLEKSFHGRTLTTLAATGQDVFHKLFQPLTPGFVHAPANDFEALKKCVEAQKTAAIMIECVQGEGGVIALDPDFVRATAAYAKEHDIILIVDEVQTGNGRTGELYGYMHYGIRPDVVSTAKGIGGGLPLGAALLSEKVATVLGHGDHGSTFGGNPVACAGAVSVISRIDEALLASVREKSAAVFALCENAKGVKSASGLGLMIGIETEKPAAEVVKKAISRGVLALTAKNKVRLLPALNIDKQQLLDAVRVILEICAED